MPHKRILMTSLWLPVCVAVKLRKGFERCGYEVVTFGPTMGRYMPWAGGTLVSESYVIESDIPMLMHEAPYQWSDVKELTGERFDVVVQMTPGTNIQGVTGVPNVCYAADNHVLQYPVEEFDLFFAAHSWGEGNDKPNFRWLPLAHDPQVNFDMDMPRMVDIALIGCIYPHRLDAIQYLLRKNVTLLINWGRILSEANELYNMARCALVYSHSHDLSDRVFENMAQGCLIVADRGITDMDKIGLQESVHYLGWGDYYELLEQIERGRVDEYRQHIVERVKDWVRPHTWQARAAAILKELSL